MATTTERQARKRSAAMLYVVGLGYWEPRRAWRWPLVIMLVQPIAMVAMAGVGNMLPLGLIMFGFLAAPGVAMALFGAGLNRS